jgi:hypothetical protein
MIQGLSLMREAVEIVSGIRAVADGLVEEFKRLLPWQRKTQRGNLALLVATMLEVRSANLMDLAAALPREADRTDMRYQWIARVLSNELIDPDAVMAPFAAEVLARAAADRRGIVLILDPSKVSDRHQVLMLALRHGERALPLAWRVETTEGAIGFEVQKALLDAVAPWMPAGAKVCLMGDRFYGTADLISLCQGRGWGYRLRLKGTLTVRDRSGRTTTAARAKGEIRYLKDVELTARRARTHIGIIRDPGHDQPWIVAMSEKPGYLTTLDYSGRWGIEPMFSDFKSRGFGVENTQIQYPDRLARLLLVMALALYSAVSTGLWDEAHHPTPAEKSPEAPARQGGAVQAVLVHPRAEARRQAHASSPAATAALENIETDRWSGGQAL